MPAREDVNDGHKILREFLIGRFDDLVLYHEFTVRPFTDPFQEIERKSTEPVPMRDNNFSDSSLDDSVHHSKESLPPKVEP